MFFCLQKRRFLEIIYKNDLSIFYGGILMAIKQVTAVQAMEEISKGKIITASLNEMQGAWIALADCEDGRVLTCAYSGECQAAALFAKKTAAKLKT